MAKLVGYDDAAFLVFLPSKNDLWQSCVFALVGQGWFSYPQKMIYGKAEVFNLLISKEERRNQAVWGRAGLAKGRRIFVVSKSGNLTVVSMPFSFALIKPKVALLAPSVLPMDGRGRPSPQSRPPHFRFPSALHPLGATRKSHLPRGA